MTAAMTLPELSYTARVDPSDDDVDGPSDWTISFGVGSPAASTYTAVAFTDRTLAVIAAAAATVRPEAIADDIVRRLARELYGTAWASVYRPDEYGRIVTRHRLRRRERVVVTTVKVYG